LAEYAETNDPLEPTNRALFAAHESIDKHVLKPAAEAYRDGIPRPLRSGIRNMLSNLREPVTFTNDLLQGETARAGTSISRFVVNSTVGVAGIFDPAKDHLGLEHHREDLGQTLATLGVPEGPYIFLPAYGPTNLRDAISALADALADPLTWTPSGPVTTGLIAGRAVATGLDTREDLLETIDTLNATSVDPYSTIRAATRQRRAAEIRNQSTP
jgi:phospholipid-binding lipoprotein MlaA